MNNFILNPLKKVMFFIVLVFAQFTAFIKDFIGFFTALAAVAVSLSDSIEKDLRILSLALGCSCAILKFYIDFMKYRKGRKQKQLQENDN